MGAAFITKELRAYLFNMNFKQYVKTKIAPFNTMEDHDEMYPSRKQRAFIQHGLIEKEAGKLPRLRKRNLLLKKRELWEQHK